MIMLSLTRAVTASAIAFAVIQATGCSGHGAAENRAPAYLAAVPGQESPPGRDDNGATRATEAAGARRMMHPTGVELHHFNVYKDFRAMLDAASDARGGDKRHRDPDRHSDADAAYSACSGDTLIKQAD